MIKRILIVDDEPLILTNMSDALHSVCGFLGEITTVENGRDAIKAVTESSYNMCFLDVNLPDLNGLDVMKEIYVRSPETCIVIMSGASVTDDMKNAIDEFSALYTEKPFDLQQIKAFLNQAQQCCE